MDFTGKYCIIRCKSAGVFAGVVQEVNGDEVVITGVRRLWYWSGAASLSQLAMEGVKNPGACKFPVEVSTLLCKEWCEIIPCTEVAVKSIKSVPVWSA